MGFVAHQSTGSGGHEGPTGVETRRSPSGGDRRSEPARPVEPAGPEPFAVDVQRRADVAIVQPRGELDVATVETLRAALDEVDIPGRLVLDLRGLSFIDSTGLHLLVTLHRRSQRDGFELTLVAPAAPIDRAITLSGLDEALPFSATVDAVGGEPAAGPQRLS
jgi:anti-sigma B factor antagonist